MFQSGKSLKILYHYDMQQILVHTPFWSTNFPSVILFNFLLYYEKFTMLNRLGKPRMVSCASLRHCCAQLSSTLILLY